MSLWKIAWRSILQRGLASSLTAFSMALGVALVTLVLLAHGILERSFKNNSSLGYNVVVGATKGGQLQLVLNTVFYLSRPVENVPYHVYLDFLNKEQQEAELALVRPQDRPAAADGKFHLYTRLAIPVCLGDYFGPYRVIGTVPRFFTDLKYGPDGDLAYRFAEGGNFTPKSPKHGFFEAVVGSTVAREMNVRVGSEISPSHGTPDGELHDENPFTVVGVLAPTGTPVDRGVYVNIEGFYLMANHARPLKEVDPEAAAAEEAAAAAPPSTGGPAPAKPAQFNPLPVKQREVTAILVQTDPILSDHLLRAINKGNEAQAAYPTLVIFELFDTLVTPIQQVLLGMTMLICVVSGISILVSIYNSMSERRHEIAVMRALGAGRSTVMSIVLLESIMLALGGGLLGWGVGHLAIGLLSPIIEARTGVSIGPFELAPSVNVLEFFLADPIIPLRLSTELFIIPGLILLAVVVGLLPALAAYGTDVAKALGDRP